MGDFTPVLISNLCYSDDIATKKKSHTWFKLIYAAVSQYTIDMITNLESDYIDELKYVQPHSFHLLQKLLTECLSDRQFSVPKKSEDIHNTKYETILFGKDSKAIFVTGETDASVIYKNVCVMTWEDKNLTEKLFTSSYLAQQYVEVKGNAEYFLSSVIEEAPNFYGVLTSDREWIFLYQTFYKNKKVWMRDETISTIKDYVNPKAETNFQ